MAGGQLDIPWREVERLREQRQYGVVRSPRIGRRADAQLPRVPVAPDDPGASRTGNDAQTQNRSLGLHGPKDIGA